MSPIFDLDTEIGQRAPLESHRNGHRSTSSSSATREGSGFAPAKLLICDDVDDIRMLVRLAFEGAPDFDVVGEASNGEEGIRAARELRPHAILLDAHMPVKSGLEALPDLREAVPNAAIVIFTGFEEWSLKAHAEEQGADGYIEKGAGIGEILDLMRSLVQVRQSADD